MPAAARQRTQHRPRGWLRHGAHVVSPVAMTAGRAALEREASQRVRRLVDAARDRAGQRARPTRPGMRALTAAPGGRMAWREVPAPPAPGPQGAIVHPVAVATCDLDRALALGATPFALPLHFGHECVAEVVEVGDEVVSVRPGDRVVVPFQISCGGCRPCRSGHTSNCARVPPLSMYGFGLGGGHWGGALSDLLAVPFADAMLVPLPPGIAPAAAASVADNVSDGWRHIGPHLPGLLERDPDAVLIVVSLRRRSLFSPSIALYAGLVARALGGKTVRVVDARAEVRGHAERLGLEPVAPGELKAVPPAPLVVEASATPGGLKAALEHTAPDGICSSLGSLHRTTRIPTGLLFARNATFTIGRTNARAVIPEVLELMADGRLRPEHVTTSLGPIDQAPRLMREHATGDSVKTILTEA